MKNKKLQKTKLDNRMRYEQRVKAIKEAYTLNPRLEKPADA